MTGKVAWFSGPKGFGFITRDDGEGDIFTHWTALTGIKGYKKLEAEQKVQFDVEIGKSGREQACNVCILEDAI